ncbi:hypothetical protein A2662_00975 [Candidatus Giovannonibacteria bacterium RIFCSPHIGHO2_01_FULL_45_33]|nr:MAG: hypothetical protein A2662_00975 [Candidatus Giovannonibacteria bacterium RIFCSPHIGHO2_01_FULL_45_33]OGF69574.1 MAG: hypothetical protein A3C73_00655 [Candidatus Giovannonibacteria bacterium RIFCSPHIGHO2_02_FULL_44_11]
MVAHEIRSAGGNAEIIERGEEGHAKFRVWVPKRAVKEIKAGDRLEVWRVPNSNLVMAHDTFVIAKEEKNFSGGGGLKKIIFSQNQYWSDFWFQRV